MCINCPFSSEVCSYKVSSEAVQAPNAQFKDLIKFKFLFFVSCKCSVLCNFLLIMSLLRLLMSYG